MNIPAIPFENKKTILRAVKAKTDCDPDKIFRLGVACFRKNLMKEATTAFRRAFELTPGDARVRSYLGLCLAMEENKIDQGLQMCEKLVEEAFFRAELFCNLGRVYLIAGQRKNAYMAFKTGLAIDHRNTDLKGELKKMGMKKKRSLHRLGNSSLVDHLAGRAKNLIGR